MNNKIRAEPTIKLSLCDALALMQNIRMFVDPETEMRLSRKPDGYWIIEVLQESGVWFDSTDLVLEIAIHANTMTPLTGDAPF